MKWRLILPFYAATAVADGSDHGQRVGVCEYEASPFRASRIDPLSLLDFQAQSPSRSEDDGILGQHNPSPSGNNWTSSSPCIYVAALGEEICVFSNVDFAQGRGISLVTSAARANFIASQPAFSDPAKIRPITNQDLIKALPAKYQMKEFPGKGMGLEATSLIKRGELILGNTPSLMIDHRSAAWLVEANYKKLLEIGVAHLPKTHQTLVMNMSTHDDVSGLPNDWIIGQIAATNAFDVQPAPGDVEQGSGFYGVFPEVSRINHDCRASTKSYFDYDTMTQYVLAVRDILPGEELSVSYINPATSQKERTESLRETWGFQCGCKACTQGGTQRVASDERIAKINSIFPEFQSYDSSSLATPALAELLLSLYKEEELWDALCIGYIFAALEYNCVGDSRKATKYARLALEHGIPASSMRSTDMVEMEKLANNPLEHWSWMYRIKNRPVKEGAK